MNPASKSTSDISVPLHPDALARLFAGGTANVSVERALEGLSAADAVRVPGAIGHSVAQVLGHIAFWQRWLLGVTRAERPAWPQHAGEGWPTVTEDEYDALKASFLADLASLQSLARDEAFLTRLTDTAEPRAWANTLLGFASHNVYHVGQIVLIRKAIGAWPPPSGGDTW